MELAAIEVVSYTFKNDTNSLVFVGNCKLLNQEEEEEEEDEINPKPLKKQKTLPYVSPTTVGHFDQSKVKDIIDKEHSKIPICKYGSNCYRQNPKHLKQFEHPPPSNNSPQNIHL